MEKQKRPNDDFFHDNDLHVFSRKRPCDGYTRQSTDIENAFRRPTYDDYTVGWVAVLRCELNAARLLLDHEHESLDSLPGDENIYVLGDMNSHNVVLACPAEGKKGESAATYVATQMIRTFQNIRFGLLVGIAGGAPSTPHPRKATKDIRLGDVVISCPVDGQGGGVRQVDYGKRLGLEEFKMTGHLNKPPNILLNGVKKLQSDHDFQMGKLHDYIQVAAAKSDQLDMEGYLFPGWQEDKLFRAPYHHIRVIGEDDSSCSHCDINHVKKRLDRKSEYPVIHYGLIASGNQVVRSAEYRDKLRNEYGFLCFEMEAAGLMDTFPCLVVRGICDYSDDHKNKLWQPYAAVTAAAYAKDLLRVVRPQRVSEQKLVSEVLQNISKDIILEVDKVRTDINEFRQDHHDWERNRENGLVREKILSWITPIDYAPQQNDTLRRRQEGTGQWLLDSLEFQTWLNADLKTLFCPGIPGAGKTILTSVVVDNLMSQFASCETVGIAYVYCNFKQTYKQRAEDLLASLLKQLSQRRKSLPKSVISLYKSHEARETKPSLEELSTNLQSVSNLYSKVFIVVDALDEADITCRKRLLSKVFGLQRSGKTNILVTSRFILDIVDSFKEGTHLEIRASKEDVERYLESQITELPHFYHWPQGLRNEVKDGISDAVDGMFLLAQIYLNSLEDKTTTKAVQQAIAQFKVQSKGTTENEKREILDQAYDQAMERISGQKLGFRQLAIKVLLWITCASRPLTGLELQHALAIEPGDKELNKSAIERIETMVFVCAGLVTIDKESHIMRLVHYTTQEYFEQKQATWFPSAQLDLARTCVTYVSFDTFESGSCTSPQQLRDRLKMNPLYDYAAKNWGNHARTTVVEIEDVTLSFLQNTSKTSACYQAAKGCLSKGCRLAIPSELSGLHLAARFSLSRAVTTLLESEGDPDPRDNMKQTPLFLAARNGHEEMVQLLLNCGANVKSVDTYGYTPLIEAVIHDNEKIVTLLLDRGAELESRDIMGMTPLMIAGWHLAKAAGKVLLDEGANINSKDKCGFTPLTYAIAMENKMLINLMIDKGLVIDSKPFSRQALSSYAAKMGYQRLVMQLLDQDTDIDSEEESTNKAFILAVQGGYNTVCELLIESGAKVRSKIHAGWTPLHLAARAEHGDVCKLLLEAGGDINAKADDDSTPLHLAALGDHAHICGRATRARGYTNLKDGFGSTYLHLAAEVGIESAAEILIKLGGSIEAKDRAGNTPLHYAVQHWNQKYNCELLLDHNAHIDSKNGDGDTPLHVAILGRRFRCLHGSLIRNSEEVLSRNDETDKTVEFAIQEWELRDICQLLLDRGAAVDLKNNQGNTPLHFAARENHKSICRLLIEAGADIESKNNDGDTPLHLATQKCHDNICRMLIESGADMTSKNNAGDIPVQSALAKIEVEVARLEKVRELLDRADAYLELSRKDQHRGLPKTHAFFAKNQPQHDFFDPRDIAVPGSSSHSLIHVNMDSMDENEFPLDNNSLAKASQALNECFRLFNENGLDEEYRQI